jgi:hypothetical protein
MHSTLVRSKPHVNGPYSVLVWKKITRLTVFERATYSKFSVVDAIVFTLALS